MRRRAKRVRRYRLLALLAWRGARQVRRHRYLSLLAWRAWRFYARRRRMVVRLAFAAAVALAGADPRGARLAPAADLLGARPRG